MKITASLPTWLSLNSLTLKFYSRNNHEEETVIKSITYSGKIHRLSLKKADYKYFIVMSLSSGGLTEKPTVGGNLQTPISSKTI